MDLFIRYKGIIIEFGLWDICVRIKEPFGLQCFYVSVLTSLTECNLQLSLVDKPFFIKMLKKFDNGY